VRRTRGVGLLWSLCLDSIICHTDEAPDRERPPERSFGRVCFLPCSPNGLSSQRVEQSVTGGHVCGEKGKLRRSSV
jgi:hypothetical protein